jgi:hypothetical protein
MTAPIIFDLVAAADALARSDEGVDPLPGDDVLIAAYEGYLQQEHDRFEDQLREDEYARWLSEQCPACEQGATGPVCSGCAEVVA